MKRMFVVAALVSLAGGAQAQSFTVLGNSFGAEALVSVDGRLLVPPNGARMQRLSADRWMRAQDPSTPQQWYDDAGRLLREDRGYTEYQERFVLRQAVPGDPLWKAFIKPDGDPTGGWGVVDALGQVRLPALKDGEWVPLAVPDRVLWNPQRGPLRFHDLHGHPVMELDERQFQWVAGPFAGRPVYVACSVQVPEHCNVLDEDGTTLFSDDIDALLPVSDGGWWLRQGELWRRVDAQGRATDIARYQQDGLYPRYRQYGGTAGRRDWPEQVHRHATGSPDDTPEPGWLMADGHFAAQRGNVRLDYCGGRWQVLDKEGAHPPAAAPAALAVVLDEPDAEQRQAPPWRVRHPTDAETAAVLDCDGKVIFAPSGVTRFDAVGSGLLGRFGDEPSPRLWWDGRTAYTVPAGMAIDNGHVTPPLLLLWEQAAGVNRLYNLARGRIVGRPFDGVVRMDADRVVFRRDGRLGMMLADGSEPVPPTSTDILPWGTDRTWTRRSLEGGDEELALLDANHQVLLRRRLLFSGVELQSTWQGDVESQPLTQLNLGTMRFADGEYFVQQWLDRNGQVLLSDISCPALGNGPPSKGKGVLLGRGWRVDSVPTRPCKLPRALLPVLAGGDVTDAMRVR
ncbi:hypothetical protein [Stenotrophomonas sp. JAI102]|uniref:hypothetical protein n=1 Tax=Stenotrophomonas sp. JAI102 TaxID=2723077 RepID=UPI0015CCE947|nr:hypothetical protein [Stenotrophomonas sp. JAI102]NYF34912.1 hypothetical protein [Stenotrophomonas sp. JAI102]